MVTTMTGTESTRRSSIKMPMVSVWVSQVDVTKRYCRYGSRRRQFAYRGGCSGRAEDIRYPQRNCLSSAGLESERSRQCLVHFSHGFIILKPVHLLWINLIIDRFRPGSGMEEAEDDGYYGTKPRGKDGIFSGGLGTDVIYQES